MAGAVARPRGARVLRAEVHVVRAVVRKRRGPRGGAVGRGVGAAREPDLMQP
jgi:hypothetical protein